MPPLPKLVLSASMDLEERVRRLDRDGVLRVVEHIESLPPDIDPEAAYPWEWVEFRLLGQRSGESSDVSIPGAALLLDLSALAERLCDAAKLSTRDAFGTISPADLCRRWEVSRKTIDRYRRQGLIARRVRDERGRATIAFTPAVCAAFESRRADTLAAARRYRRTPRNEEERILRRATVYRRRFGCSLNAAALRLSRRFGRSHEAVRQMLIRHDERSPAPIFGRRIEPSSRRRRTAHRALARGIEPAEIGRRWKRSSASVLRLAVEHRAHLLRTITPAEVEEVDEEHLRSLLEAAPVREGLGSPGVTDLLNFIADARTPRVPIAVVENAQARALHGLVAAAHRRIAALPRSGAPAAEVDEIETMLRWAARLKAELIRAELPLAIRTLESHLHSPLERVRAADLVPLIRDAISAIGDAVDRHDPARGGRLAAPVGLSLNRLASRRARELARSTPAGRAAPQLRPGVSIDDWTRAVAPWQRWLEPDRRIRGTLESIDPAEARLLCWRFGWGGPPMTSARIARQMSTTVMRAVVVERTAIRHALAAVRATP